MPRALMSYAAPAPSRALWLLHRTLLAASLLALAAAAVTVFLVITGALSVPDVIAWGASIRTALDQAAGATGFDRAIAGASAVVVALLALTLLLRSVRSSRPTAIVARHILKADEQGVVLIENASVQTVVQLAALSTPGVVDATVLVRGKAAGPVQLLARIDVLPGVDVQRAGDEARRRIRATVEDMVGLSVRDASVEVHVLDTEALVQVLS